MNLTQFSQSNSSLFNDVAPADKASASWEILLMLIGAYILGVLSYWLICNYKHRQKKVSNIVHPTTSAVVTKSIDKPVVKQVVKPVAKKSVATPVTKKAVSTPVKNSSGDNFSNIEGIGPKISELLRADGIKTFSKLAQVDAARLKKVLKGGGSRFQLHDPSSWPKQARLAADGKYKELKTLQNKLKGGK